MKITFTQIESMPLPDQIFQLVQEAIINGNIPAGERINAYKLARQFKVSPIPVREAIRKLEAVGLIETHVNKSARVIELSKDDVQNIFEVRKALEGLAVQLAAARMNATSRKKLQVAVNAMNRIAKSNDLVGMFAADKAFHEIIWHCTGNPFLIKALNMLLLPYFGFLASNGYQGYLMDLNQVVAGHQDLLDALASQDGELARRIFFDTHGRMAARFANVTR